MFSIILSVCFFYVPGKDLEVEINIIHVFLIYDLCSA